MCIAKNGATPLLMWFLCLGNDEEMRQLPSCTQPHKRCQKRNAIETSLEYTGEKYILKNVKNHQRAPVALGYGLMGCSLGVDKIKGLRWENYMRRNRPGARRGDWVVVQKDRNPHMQSNSPSRPQRIRPALEASQIDPF